MEDDEASAAKDATAEDTLPEIPVLEPVLRKERYEPERPTIVRDFAYAAEDPLFWRLDDRPDDSREDVEDDARLLETAGRDDPDGGGFRGAPPWLQSTTHEGGLSEEDHTSQAPDDELHGRAVALFDFDPEHENEFALQEGQIIYISSRHGLGWLVAVDMLNGDCGLVPEEYVRLLEEGDEGFHDDDLSMQEHDAHDDLSTTPRSTGGRKTGDLAQQTDDDTGEWEDDEETTSHGGHESMAEADDEDDASHEPSAAAEMSDEERQKIMDAAEREMALVDARLREDM